MTQSFSYWIDEVATEMYAAYFLNGSGKRDDQSTVRFGSGAGPMFSSVCKNLKQVLVTSGLPSEPTPATSSVAQTGSPENN